MSRLPAGIRRRGPSFTYTWRDAAGRQYSRRAGATITEAKAFKTTIDADLARGTFTASTKVTVADYATGWIETWPLKDATRARYRSALNAHVLPTFGNVPMSKIHPHLLRGWIRAMSATDLAPNTVRQNVAVLKALLKAAQLDGHLAVLPLSGLQLPKAVKRRPQVLTLVEALALVDATPAAWRAATCTAVFTGLRLGELLALRRCDLDLDGGVLTVVHTLSEVSGRAPRLQLEPPKSDAGIRDVPLVDQVVTALRSHLEQLDRTHPSGTEHDLVFVSATGGPVSKSNFYRDVWHPVRQAMDRPSMHFHELRHTAASLLLAYADAQLAELKMILGHSQISHTVDIYGHLVPGRLDDIRDNLNEALPGPGPTGRRLRLVPSGDQVAG